MRSVSGLWFLGVAAVAFIGCGDDSSNHGTGPGHVAADGGGGGDPTGRTMDAGPAGMDAGKLPPAADASWVDGSTPGSDAAIDPELPADGGLPVSLTPLPEDGTKLSACYNEADCNKGLTCVGPLGALGAGFCNSSCTRDKDCEAIDGVAATCSINGQCVLSCSNMFAGGGACPTNMECRNINPPGLIALPTYECRYPLGSGSKSVGAFGECDLGHGGGDCTGVQSCHVPVGDVVTVVTAPVGPGYCAPHCSAAADCQVPTGVTAAALCNFGECELDCSGMGAVCPTGMNCIDVDEAPLLQTMRCRYIN